MAQNRPLVLPDLEPKTALEKRAPKTIDLDPYGAAKLPTIRLQPFVPLDGLRPKALTPEIEAVLYGLVARGVDPSTAGKMVGLSPSRLKIWRSKYKEFGRNLDAAEAHCQAQIEQYMAEHAPLQWLKARGEAYKERPSGPVVLGDYLEAPKETTLSKRLASLPDSVLERLVELGAEVKQLTTGETIDATFTEVSGEPKD
jgi:hypothetical protein